MTQNDLFYLLALQQVEGIGDITAKKLLQHLTLKVVLSLSLIQL
jgi:hypothetical protein